MMHTTNENGGTRSNNALVLLVVGGVSPGFFAVIAYFIFEARYSFLMAKREKASADTATVDRPKFVIYRDNQSVMPEADYHAIIYMNAVEKNHEKAPERRGSYIEGADDMMRISAPDDNLSLIIGMQYLMKPCSSEK